jgi:dTMP kinase
MKKGKLIFVEGTDGAGKTTAIEFMIEKLKALGSNLQQVNILSGHPTSAEIRKILTNPDSTLSPNAEVALYIGAVQNTLDNVVTPLLEQGIDVICDRGPMSSLIYQCMWQWGQGNEVPAKMHSEAFENYHFDALVLVTCKPETGLERCRTRSGQLDRLEQRGLEYFQNIVANYRREVEIVSREKPGRVHIIENDGTLAELQENCRSTAELIL